MSAVTLPAPEALLFDLDGVIADVSHSYRRAILETATTFGVTIAPAAVRAAKAAGNANNDWELTHRLLGERGVDVPFEQVKTRFERLYLGTDAEPGLRATERLIPERGLLERLAARLPLGIVTGRPRRDAQKFLRDHEIERLFQQLVCMEDAPAKPDPAPVELLKERMGVKGGWMIGDTPDDMRAAVAAGVVALGILAPGDREDAVIAAALREAGGAQLLKDLGALEALLSQHRDRLT